MKFDQIFDRSGRFESRDKFLSRLFGIFNEEIVRIWCTSESSPFLDIGRPTIKLMGDTTRGSTLDFTLQEKKSNKVFVAEMKCEIQYENYRYLELNSEHQLKHHNKEAFQRFLQLARGPKNFQVRVNRKELAVDGAILIWGKVDNLVIEKICSNTSLNEILSLEDIINNLISERNKEYLELIEEKQRWVDHLFDGLKSIN